MGVTEVMPLPRQVKMRVHVSRTQLLERVGKPVRCRVVVELDGGPVLGAQGPRFLVEVKRFY